MKSRSHDGAALFNLALSMCCLLGLAASAYFLSREQGETDSLVKHSQEVVSHVTSLQQLALDAESTGRAFLLVGEPQLLKRYKDAMPLIDGEITTIRTLLADDAKATAQLADLERGLDTRFAFFTSLTDIRVAQGLDATVRAASTGKGRAEMGYIGYVLSDLKDSQHARLREYLAQREQVMVRLWMMTFAFIAAGLALAVWVYRQARSANESRQSYDREKEHMARHDALTGLANRRYLQERLAAQIEEAARRGSGVVVMYLDLDGFKEVNDTFGHDSGDELLVDVARRLRGALREDDVVSRLGGDEFVVSLAHLHSDADTEFVANKLVAALAAPYSLNAGEARVSASIGVATFPRDGESPKDLLVAADRALYAAKTSGKNRFRRANEAVRANVASTPQEAGRMRRAPVVAASPRSID